MLRIVPSANALLKKNFYIIFCSEKQGGVYNHIGSCYEMLRQYNQAIFCHRKVHIVYIVLQL